MNRTTYYKVTGPKGESIHGGDLQWSLPTQEGETWIPGGWHEVRDALALCSVGLHLTSEPAAWWAVGARCFVAEYAGEAVGDGCDKIAVRKARLIREVDGTELEAVQIFTAGSHVCTRGSVWAYGSATVWAYDSATVWAYGSATVWASDSATVEAYGSATVEAYDSATVWASGSATVWAYDSATVLTAWGHPTITVSDHAVWIDRRSGQPGIHCLAGEIVRGVA